MGSSPFDCTSATPRSPRGVSLCRAGTLSLWLTRSAPCATIAIPSLRSLRVPSTAPASRKCKPFIRSSFLRSTPKLSLFHSFSLRGAFRDDDNVMAEHFICQGKGLEPPSPLTTISNTPQNCGCLRMSLRLLFASRKCKPFIRSSFLRSTPKLSLFHSFSLRGAFRDNDNVIAERLICQGKGLERAGRKTAFGRDCSISRAHSVLTMRVREGKMGV